MPRTITNPFSSVSSDPTERAKSLLAHYLQNAAAGIAPDTQDHFAEIASLVDDIVEAALQAVIVTMAQQNGRLAVSEIAVAEKIDNADSASASMRYRFSYSHSIDEDGLVQTKLIVFDDTVDRMNGVYSVYFFNSEAQDIYLKLCTLPDEEAIQSFLSELPVVF
jgi:hypothetical protein